MSSGKRKVLAVGLNLPSVEGFDVVTMVSQKSWLDADVIVVEPNLSDFHIYGEYEGVPNISEASSATFRQLRQRWLPQVNAALASGKLVVFFLPHKVDRFYYTGTTQERGTPGRPRPTKIVGACSNYDFIPFKLKGLTIARGSEMVLDSGAEVVSAYWAAFGKFSSYSCYFQQGELIPLIKTRSGDHLVGALAKAEGLVLLLPEISLAHLDEDDEEGEDVDGDPWPKSYIKFSYQLRDVLLEISRRLTGAAESTPQPDWADAPEFRLNVEAELESEIIKIESEITELVLRRDDLKDNLKNVGSLRTLLYETGTPLEIAVREALVTLGFEADHFKGGDSEFDALFTGPEGRFLGEVEGKENKAINVDKFSQLQRNLGEDLRRDEVEEMAIGVLFGNAFRLRPIEERDDFFTQKVKSAAKASNVALVRTSDLFKVARALKNNSDPSFAQACREAIRDGVGAVVIFPEPTAEVGIAKEASQEPPVDD